MGASRSLDEDFSACQSRLQSGNIRLQLGDNDAQLAICQNGLQRIVLF